MGQRKSQKKGKSFGKRLLVIFSLIQPRARDYACFHPAEARQKVNDLVVRAENVTNKGMSVKEAKRKTAASELVAQSATIPPENQPVITIESKYDNISLGVPCKAPDYALGCIEYHEQPTRAVYHFINRIFIGRTKRKTNVQGDNTMSKKMCLFKPKIPCALALNIIRQDQQ